MASERNVCRKQAPAGVHQSVIAGEFVAGGASDLADPAAGDEVLGWLSPLFDEMYAQGGRPLIPPERLFCEQLRYDLLFRWFLGMDLTEEPFVASTLSKNRERLLAQDVAKVFFRAVYELAREADWASDEHFTVDGTLIEAVASLKSFAPKDGSGPDLGGQGI